MHDNYSNRAGFALDALFAGPDRDKRIAQALGVSARMARYLCSGKKWRPARFVQAMELFGDAFAAALSKPDGDFSYNLEVQDLNRRVARLEQYIATLDRMDTPLLAPQPGGSGDVGRRGFAHEEPAAPERGDP